MEIAFSYKKLSPHFSGCGRSLQQTLADILEGRLLASDLPQIAVLAMPNAGGERGSAEAKKSKGGKKSGGKGGKSKRFQRDDGSDDDDGDGFFGSGGGGLAGGGSGSGGSRGSGSGVGGGGGGVLLPVAQRYRYFSLNNRRLWVLRQARLAGMVGAAVACRLKPSDVCDRLLAPVSAASV
jgi:hypothetical protein